MSPTPGCETDVAFNARVHALEVRMAVLEGRSPLAYTTGTGDTPPVSAAIRAQDAAQKATATADKALLTAVSDRDAARRERDSNRAEAAAAELARDAAIMQRDTAVEERDTARRELSATAKDRDAARRQRDNALATLNLSSLATPNMAEQYTCIIERLRLIYTGTTVGVAWKQVEEEALRECVESFDTINKYMKGSSTDDGW